MPGTIVIGAGVSGLAAALELDRADADFVVLDQSDSPGGAMRSHEEKGYRFEDGPTSVLDSGGAFRGLCAAVGLEQEIVDASPAAKDRWIWHRGALEPVPSSPTAFMKSPLLGFAERLRFLREAFISPGAAGVEESVAAFVERRFGSGAVKLAGAAVSGVYAGDPARLSVDAAFPEIRRIEREHGSLLKGAGAGSAKGRRLQSLRGGLGRVPAACRAKLGTRFVPHARVEALAKAGGRLAAVVESRGARETLEADAVIVATPARAAASLLHALAPSSSAALAAIGQASLALVQVGLGATVARGAPSGFGFLVPRGEGLESLGWVLLSRIFDGHAPDGCLALTGFFGGLLAPLALALSDSDLGGLAVREIGRVLGRDVSAGVEVLRVVRWKEALPQYDLGHAARVDGILKGLHEHPGLFLAGNWLRGISVAECIASGTDAARAASGRIGARS